MSGGAFEIETERQVIGAVLVHPKTVDRLPRLKPDHFSMPALAETWRSICALRDASAPIDAIAVYEDLRRRDRSKLLDPLGGSDLLPGLMTAVVTVENIEWHSRRLLLAARRRAWLAFARKLAVEAEDDGVDSEDLLEAAELESARLAIHDDHEGGPREIKPLLKEIRTLMEKRSENRSENALTGPSWGFKSMDFYTQGLHPQEMIVVGARPRMGKTTWTMNVLSSLAARGIPCLMISLEMSARSIIEKAIAAQSGVPAWDLRAGRLDGEKWRKAGGAMSAMSEWPLQIDERGGLDMIEIRATVRRWVADRREQCNACRADAVPCTHRVVAIDYLQMIRPPASERRRQASREQEVSDISRGCKELAKELKIPLIVMAQLSRRLEERSDKRPMLADLRESGSIEQDADVIAFIHREHVYDKEADPKLAEIIIGKQREGDAGEFKLRWNAPMQRFENRSDEEEEEDRAEKKQAKQKGSTKKTTAKGAWHPHAPESDD